MTTRRAKSVAGVQNRELTTLKIARRRHEPVGLGHRSISALNWRRLALLEGAETLVHLARLNSMSAHSDEARQLVVIANAVVDAIAGSITGDPHRTIEALYTRVVAQEQEGDL